MSCLPFLPWISWGSNLSLHSRRPVLSWGSLRTSRPHVSWFSSRPLVPIVSWRAWQSNLPPLAWSPWRSRWACLSRKTRRPHQGQCPDLLKCFIDAAVVVHHLSLAGFTLGTLGASWSRFPSCSWLPLVSLLSWGTSLAIDTSFSLWPRGPRGPWEPRRARLPPASSNGVAGISLFSLLPQEARGACSTLLTLGSWRPWLTLHPSHGNPRNTLGSVLAWHSWQAPLSLAAVIALDPWVSLWSRRPG